MVEEFGYSLPLPPPDSPVASSGLYPPVVSNSPPPVPRITVIPDFAKIALGSKVYSDISNFCKHYTAVKTRTLTVV